MRICSNLLNKFLTKKFIFCSLICASKWTENYCEEKKHVASLFTFFKKSLQFAIFFTARCLDVRFCILFVWSSIHSIAIFFFAGLKLGDLVAVFNKGRGETFAVSWQNRKSCVCIKYLTLVRRRKLTPVNFSFLYSM